MTAPVAAPPAAPSPRRRGLLVVAFVAAVVAALVAAVTVVLIEDEVDGPELVERAIEFIDDSKGVHFTGELVVKFTDATADETVSTRTRVEGDTDFERSRLIAKQGELVAEVITVGSTVYVREADTERGLRSEKFGEFDPDQQARQAGIVAPGEAQRSAETGEPGSLPELLRGAERARIESSEDGVYVVVAGVDDKVLEDSGTPGDGRLRLTMRKGGRVDKARIEVEGEDADVAGQYSFTRWGERVEIATPPASQIDPTPMIEEEELAAWDDAPLLSPRSLPEGWELEGAYIVPAEQTVEECEQVEIDYVDPDDPEAGYLSLFQIPRSCEGLDLDVPRGAEPFTVGRAEGYVEEEEGGTYAQVVLGDTVIQVDTDLDRAALSAVVASLGPLDLEAVAVPLPGGRTQSA